MSPAPALAERLALLARQSGRADGAPARSPAAPAIAAPGTPMDGAAMRADAPGRPPAAFSFAERLHRLDLRARAFRRPTDDQLAERLGGRLRAEGLIEIEYRHDLAQPHGHCSLAGLAAPDLCWLTGQSQAGPAPALLFIDTETTGLAGGTGTLAFLLGIAQVHGESLVFTQWLITRFGAERQLLAALAARVAAQQATDAAPARPVEWVSYNGKSFDLPLLAARLRLARLPDTISGLAHHDLLHPTRTAFARHWPDCRLQTVEQQLLGVHRHDDLPGHRIPAVWADFVQFGDASELAAMVAHNRVDLLSLAALLPALTRVYLEPAMSRIPDPAGGPPAPPSHDVAAIARMQLRRRRPASARAHLSASEAVLDTRALHELADLHRAQRDWTSASRLWRALATDGSLAALESLAKYHEHVTRDLVQAILCCEALCRGAPGNPEHARRLQRLLSRRQRQAVRRFDLFESTCPPSAAGESGEKKTGRNRPVECLVGEIHTHPPGEEPGGPPY